MSGSNENLPLESFDIAARFFEAAGRYGDIPALGRAGEDAYLTYGQLARLVRECAVFLGSVEPGEPIGILSENRPAWCKIYLAILARGGVVVPIDSLLKKEELRFVFAEAGIRRLFVSHRFADIADEVNDSLERKINIINLE
jgi:long-subunit acyl-CoA synthetase (AMP-forming)